MTFCAALSELNKKTVDSNGASLLVTPMTVTIKCVTTFWATL